MSIIGIGAMTEDGVVATKNGDLPWGRHREDMAHFVGITKWCGTVVMGSSTYKEIGQLPDRDNIVISNRLSRVFPDHVFRNFSVLPIYRLVDENGLDSNLYASDSLKGVLDARPSFNLLSKVQIGGKLAIIGGPTIWKWTHFYTGFDEFYLTVIPNDALLTLPVKELNESPYKFPWCGIAPSQLPEIHGMIVADVSRFGDGTKFVKYVRA